MLTDCTTPSRIATFSHDETNTAKGLFVRAIAAWVPSGDHTNFACASRRHSSHKPGCFPIFSYVNLRRKTSVARTGCRAATAFPSSHKEDLAPVCRAMDRGLRTWPEPPRPVMTRTDARDWPDPRCSRPSGAHRMTRAKRSYACGAEGLVGKRVEMVE